MDIKKFITGTIVAGVLSFLLGWLIYGMLLASYFQKHTGKIGSVDRPEPEMLYLALGNLFYGALVAYIIIRAGVKTVAGGFITGATIGFLISVSMNCMMYGLTYITSKHAMLADVIASVIMVGIVGAVTALVTAGKPAAA
ncbi:MAG TPA: hypothetical protein PKC39_10415 [Ferruginibacter sp.]|nr:hypothetical protein [Ferruginibacter sp.]HMP21363.1 hypothetical protein [Ferruginibacter sp.]